MPTHAPLMRFFATPTTGGLFDTRAMIALMICIGIGALTAYWMRLPGTVKPPRAQRLRTALTESVAFPLVTWVALFIAAVAFVSPAFSGTLRFASWIFGALVVIRFFARVLRRFAPTAEWTSFLINLVNVVVWSALLLYLTGLLPTLVQELEDVVLPFGKSRVSLWQLLQALVAIGVTAIVAMWISSAIETRLMKAPLALSLRLVLTRAMRALLIVLALLIALSAVGLDLTILSVFGGALGVGLGLGLQRIAANYVSGFAILLERSFRVGDFVRVDNFEGVISDIKTRYTVVRDGNGAESVVPNEMFMINRVVNYSLSEARNALSTVVFVHANVDIDATCAALEDAARGVPRVLAEPAPSTQLREFTVDGMSLQLTFWISDIERGRGNVRSEVNRAVLSALRARNIPLRMSMIDAGTPTTTGD